MSKSEEQEEHHIDDIDNTKFYILAQGGQTRGHILKLVKQRTASRLRHCVLEIPVVIDWNGLN